MTEPAPSTVWARPRPEPRRRAPGVDQYVAAALAVADAEGLAAVSMRRVAGDLGSGTATLYRYIANRDELVDLMVDAAQGEDPLPEPTRDWRADLAAVAHALRATLLRHPWLAGELAGRPSLGPNSLRRSESALRAAVALTPDITLASQALVSRARVRARLSGHPAGRSARRAAHRPDRGAVAAQRRPLHQRGPRGGRAPDARPPRPRSRGTRPRRRVRVRPGLRARRSRGPIGSLTGQYAYRFTVPDRYTVFCEEPHFLDWHSRGDQVPSRPPGTTPDPTALHRVTRDPAPSTLDTSGGTGPSIPLHSGPSTARGRTRGNPSRNHNHGLTHHRQHQRRYPT